MEHYNGKQEGHHHVVSFHRNAFKNAEYPVYPGVKALNLQHRLPPSAVYISIFNFQGHAATYSSRQANSPTVFDFRLIFSLYRKACVS